MKSMMKAEKAEKIARYFNNFLAVVVFVVSLYILIAPFVPELMLPIERLMDDTEGVVYSGKLADEEGGSIPEDKLLLPPESNRLVIPKIRIDGELHEGDNAYETLNKGIWHKPSSQKPGQGGNSVFLAHRALYRSGPNTFYHLPKLEIGDKFAIFWEGEEFVYEIEEVKIVPATAIEIEENTDEEIVTLYTCTPLLTSKNRFVVRGKPV